MSKKNSNKKYYDIDNKYINRKPKLKMNGATEIIL